MAVRWRRRVASVNQRRRKRRGEPVSVTKTRMAVVQEEKSPRRKESKDRTKTTIFSSQFQKIGSVIFVVVSAN